MNKKNRSIIRAIIITLSVFAVIIVSLSFCLMKHLMGVSKEKTEAEARAFHNIDESWQSIQATNDDVSAMLFFPADRSSHFYSIYCKHKGLSKGFFFRIGGTISEISSECVQFVFEDNNSQIYASMNKQKICKVEIDDGDHVNTISLNEDDPFILVFPSNAGNVTLSPTLLLYFRVSRFCVIFDYRAEFARRIFKLEHLACGFFIVFAWPAAWVSAGQILV